MNNIKTNLKVYKLDFLAKHFRVTKATILRWQKLGIVPLKYAQLLVNLKTY